MPEYATLGDFMSAHPALLGVGLVLLGLTIGSFLNVVILRLPVIMRREWASDCRALLELEDAAEPVEAFSLSFPGSHCPGCHAAIKPWHNIPLFGFLLLRGRCANCGVRISWRYPLVEALTAALTLIAGLHFGWLSPLCPSFLLRPSALPPSSSHYLISYPPPS